ncbi:acetate CoA-transferase subunit alpha [Thermosipho africanus H17ap60334]|uniref:Acetate CoA-transferase subunit alpha n=1 Tax=Thermosipho africanus (strain TCF52B) TaxID=484019 RepID=B7ID08_THEAB|nr:MULTISPECIES: acetate CoA-transferase subunit alpha [Thermosipho]HCF37975.1 acetate CoA-transferase subunit alpha [Thermosipho africanus]ACJ75885.1 acetate CoA-transferase subunit alpha [Thermosipho africanus TCF52B]EKF49893.1 acetate CoA-transferase subunit alpha [Thermosipho africanus H17ap60334]MBZ4650100.1 acetate CoA-transferase subunit alpha [Thermosipho sp. (in: thermotogales)]MDK2838926.1 acetate CoA/acetoacetate CoA-transferase alpha subunit [Thermosipho sp. (in: thermotogales)]
MKIIDISEIKNLIKEGSTIMIGGFLGVGTPEKIIDEIIKNKIKNLTVIANDTAFEDKGIGKLVKNKLCKKVIVSHIGTNPETQRQMIEGTLQVELVPQGTLAERIRAGGVGLGGILTPTGVGTIVEEGKQIIEIEGKKYLLELPLRADVALIKAKKADYIGNLVFNLTAENFNPLMALSANTVIVEVEEIVPTGSLSPNEIKIPGVVVDYIVGVEK